MAVPAASPLRTRTSSSPRPRSALRRWGCHSRGGACASWPHIWATTRPGWSRSAPSGSARYWRPGATFQRTKTWKESNDPERDAKLDRIEEVLGAFPRRCYAFDEFGPLQIRPVAGAGSALAGRPPRIAANYHKTHGVRQFHGCYSIGGDTLWGVVRQRKSAANTLAALKSIRARHSDGERIYVILDNLSAHKGRSVRQWARDNRVELCFTPTYSSWANPIEAHFGPLREFVLNNSQHPNHTVLTRRLHAYLRWRNANARDPDLLAAQRRERARTRAEKGHRWGRPLPQAA